MRNNKGNTKVRERRRRRYSTVAACGGPVREQIFIAAIRGPMPEEIDVPKDTAACGESTLEKIFLTELRPVEIPY